MKRKIYRNSVFLSILAILIATIFLLYSFYGFYSSKEKQHIRNYTYLLANSIERDPYESLEDLWEQFNPKVRVTLVESTGEVIFDSMKNPELMENHINRKEITDAIEKGRGESIRYSTTLEENTYYYAVKLSNNNILRVGLETSNIISVFFTILPSIIISIIILLLISLIISSILSKKILFPIESITNNMDKLIISNKLNTVEIYDELLPFIKTLVKQREEIKTNMEDITEKANIMDIITSNIKEGLILIDNNKYILSANESSIELLNGNKDKSYLSQSFLSLCRNIDLNNKIEEVMKNRESSKCSIDLNGKFLDIFINPILNNDRLMGLVLVLLDSTKEHKTDLIRKEFSANVSHELKTPLTSINGYAEMIENGIAKGEDIRLFASIIKKEGSRLLNLINSIIKLSKLEDDTVERKMEYLDIYSIGENIVSNLSFLAKEKNISLQFSGKKTYIYGNRIMIEELIYNLLDNAIKYTKPSGNVHLEIYQESGKIIKVTDTGIGIPLEYQDRIFERFFMVDKSRSKKLQSSGLGLSIVKHIVEYHNGSISLKSEVNKGTEINVVF